MRPKLNGYIRVGVTDIRDNALLTIEHISKERRTRDVEFKDWAFPYFNKFCRQKWWQFWRRKPLHNLKVFEFWFFSACYRVYGSTLIRAPANITGDDENAFAQVSERFNNSGLTMYEWYPSSYGYKEAEVCNRLLIQVVPTLKENDEILLSVEDYTSLMFGKRFTD